MSHENVSDLEVEVIYVTPMWQSKHIKTEARLSCNNLAFSNLKIKLMFTQAGKFYEHVNFSHSNNKY